MAVDTNMPAKNGNGSDEEYAIFQAPRLPWDARIEKAFGGMGVNKGTWKALTDAVFPSAKNVDTIILALSYCKSRNLDVFKRPVHIVPMYSPTGGGTDGNGKAKGGLIDTVWPSIAELRTTAHRTQVYAGCDRIEWGPLIKKEFNGRQEVWDNGSKVWKDIKKEVTFPEYAQLTVYRIVDGQRVAFHGPEVYWEEAYATLGKTELPNEMWTERARGQIGKCAEAAALRLAFPEELGGMLTAEEMEGRTMQAVDITPKVDSTPPSIAPPPKQQAQLELTPEPAKEAVTKTEAKPKEKAAPKVKPKADAAEVAAMPASKEEPAPTITDPAAYVEEFETKIMECQGDVDAMAQVWTDHEEYDSELPVHERGQCREIYRNAGGEFPE